MQHSGTLRLTITSDISRGEVLKYHHYCCSYHHRDHLCSNQFAGPFGSSIIIIALQKENMANFVAAEKIKYFCT